MNIQYKDWDASLDFASYVGNENTALQLIDNDSKESITVATVNIGVRKPKDVLMIKSWSENTGIVEELIREEVIQPKPVSTHASGFVQVNAYKLTDKAEAVRQQQYKKRN